VSNTNSDGPKDKVESKFDCEYEVRNCIFLFIIVYEEGRKKWNYL
jgi:hypothetical protein